MPVPTRPTQLVLVMFGILLIAGCEPTSSDDPDNARCDRPQASFGAPSVLPDHSAMSVRFTCAGAVQSGTVYIPGSAGPHPGAVWVFGKGPTTRLDFGAPIVSELVKAGVAVLSYDKRGVGDSE